MVLRFRVVPADLGNVPTRSHVYRKIHQKECKYIYIEREREELIKEKNGRMERKEDLVYYPFFIDCIASEVRGMWRESNLLEISALLADRIHSMGICIALA